MLLPLCDRNFIHYLYWVSCRSCFEIRIQILCQLGFHLRLMSMSIYLGQQFFGAWILQTMSGIENNLLWSWWGTHAANGRPGDHNHSPGLEATLKAETEGYWKESSSYRPRTKWEVCKDLVRSKHERVTRPRRVPWPISVLWIGIWAVFKPGINFSNTSLGWNKSCIWYGIS